MFDAMGIMKLVPKAKLLVKLLQSAMTEYDQNIKKYNIKPNDTQEYHKLKNEIQEIMEKDKPKVK